jgi:RNA polymerase sigma factor (sigma-70 family)
MSEAYEELIGRELDDLYSAARCFTLNEGRAEELLQEAAIRGFHAFSRRRQAQFHGWMLGMLVATHLERERRRGADPLGSSVEGVEIGEWSGAPRRGALPGPDDPAASRFGAWLERAWAELDDGDRLILWLADVERLRHAEIADIVGRPEEDVRRRHYRGRRVLSRRARIDFGGRAAAGAGE